MPSPNATFISLAFLASPSPTPSPSPIPPPIPQASRVTLPILMYHYVGELPPNADAIRRDLTVSTANFMSQMDYLSQQGYQTVTLNDLVAALQGSGYLPPKPVILTFDDGYKNNFQEAYPVLRARGFTGTFFIIVRYVGTPAYMSWDEIAELAAAGMDIESHTYSHPDLTTLSPEAIAGEVREAERAIESHQGKRPRFFSYPAGRYSAPVIKVLKDAGYLAAVTTRYGSQHSADALFELARIRVSGSDSLGAFAQKLGQSP